MKVVKLGAIDIGSNSIRCLVANVIPGKGKQETLFKKSSLNRLPIRLGADVFTKGKISATNYERMVWGLKAFENIMKVNGVVAYRACATSAMREAKNGAELIAAIKEETGIEIEIIDGQEEARLLFSKELLTRFGTKEDSFLYVDVGGGSTELTLFNNKDLVASRSFNIGTVRVLQGLDKKEEWQAMRQWIKDHLRDVQEDVALVGSGGNINRLFKMSGKKIGVPLTMDYLEEQYEFIQKFSQEDRVRLLDLNIDRADVIVPALRIYMSAMEWAHAERIYVPKVGLSDGIVRDLYKSTFQNFPKGS